MQFTSNSGSVTDIQAEALVVGLFADEELSGAAASINEATSGALQRLLDADELSRKPAGLTSILAPAGLSATQVLTVGLGPRADLNRRVVYRSVAAAAKKLARKQRSQVTFCLNDLTPELTETAVCAAMVGCTGQDLYRAEKKLTPFEHVVWHDGDETAIENGVKLGEAVNLTRRLVNEPAGVIYPVSFAEAVVKEFADSSIDVEVWDADKLKTERCGSLLAVAQGSAQPPRLAILRYNGGPSGQKPLALVGKGVTFDSGGLSLKPTEGMKTMKCDMAGAATVVGAMKAIAELKVPVNVIGLVGLVENMVSGTSYKLGDVLTARNGKTIEVLNTDAEGRLVLADVLSVAVDQGAERIIDMATLTGACIVALGFDVAGAMTNDQKWCDQIIAAGQRAGEHVWQLPMYKEFNEQIRSGIADIKNVGEGRWGGAITAAKFLEEFVGDTPWTHLDIAGPSFLDSGKSWNDAGATGAIVRTLVELVRS